MKGLMVPLLFFMATGIVVGQQSSSDIFDIPRTPASPEPDDSYQATGSSLQTQTNQEIGSQSTDTFDEWINDKASIFELVMSNDQLWSLADGQPLEFPFELKDGQGNEYPKDTADAVRLRLDQGRVSETISPISGFRVNELGQTVLEFELTPTQIAQIRSGEQNFAFKIPENQRGDYDVVRVVTQNESVRRRSEQPAIPNQDFGGGNGFAKPRQPSRQRSQLDPVFPPQPSQGGRLSAAERDRRDRVARASSTSPLTNEESMRTRPTNRNGFDWQNPSVGQVKPFSQDRDRVDAAASTELLAERERRLRLEAELEKLQYQQQLEQRQTAATLESFRDEVFQLKKQQQNRVRSMNDPLFRSADLNNNVTLGGGNSSPLDDGAAAPIRRDVSGDRQTEKQPNPDDVKAVAARRSTDPMLFFLFLASLGLNAYLAILARSFYVRYGELASELRETFASTA